MTRILHQDFRHPTARVCDRARDLFFRRFGLDWDRFKAEGMDANELRGPGQHMDLIDRLEAVARAREAANG
jgi:hypothetical protein